MDITSTCVQVVYINAHSHRELSLVDVDPCTPACGVLSIIQPGKIYSTFSLEGEIYYTLLKGRCTTYYMPRNGRHLHDNMQI